MNDDDFIELAHHVNLAYDHYRRHNDDTARRLLVRSRAIIDFFLADDCNPAAHEPQ